MSKSNAFETALLQLFFQNANVANVGDATGVRGSSAAGSLYLALHTADPGEAGDQSTNEVSYGSYARVAVARSAGGFTVSGNNVQLVAEAAFPLGTSGAATQNGAWASIGTLSSGAGMILYRAQLATALFTGSGIQPKLSAGTGFSVTED